MKLPVQFPNDADVISEESQRFRALSSAERIELIRGLLAAGALMLSNSPKAAFLTQYAAEQEIAAERAFKEFVARHAQ